jgi:16S rRNA (cytidine1402-2'-O)-methyltransferase
MTGKLYLVPTPLDHGTQEEVALDITLPAHTVRTAASVTHWICENAKSTRAFLNRVNAVVPLAVPINEQVITELPHVVRKKGDHSPGSLNARPLLEAAQQGHDMGLISEAGMPAIADPGSSVVRAAHELKIAVVPLPGSVSLMLALAASGLNGQQFAFYGYLPQDQAERSARIRQLESVALTTGQTQLFIEAPYRNAALLRALVFNLKASTRIVIAWGLTLAEGKVDNQSSGFWQKQLKSEHGSELMDRLNSLPCVFAIGP